MEKPSKSWEAGAYDREKGEWVTTILHSYDHSESPVSPVTVRNIELDESKPHERPYKRILALSDVHIGYRNINGELEPLHDEQAIKRVLDLAEDIQPDYVVNLGDLLDNSSLSRFAPDSTHFQGTMQPSYQRAHDFLADVSERTPQAERHMLEGNHDKRHNDYLLKNAGAMAELDEIKLHRILKLGEIGWKYHGGYPAAEYEYAEDLVFIHGQIATKTGTAHKLAAANYDRNIVQGHKHCAESVYHTDRRGRTLGAFVVGMLGRIDGTIPAHNSGVDHDGEPVKKYDGWTQGIMVVNDYEGVYEFQQVPIHEDGLFFNGKRY